MLNVPTVCVWPARHTLDTPALSVVGLKMCCSADERNYAQKPVCTLSTKFDHDRISAFFESDAAIEKVQFRN